MLQVAVDWVVYSVLKFNPESRLGGTVHFFIYDSVKIFALLYGMILAIGILRTYLPEEKIRNWLNRKKGLSHLTGSLFGAATPFCSCSSIPIFIGFLKAGIPLGVAFSFLVTSPLINEYLAVLMFGFFGWKIAVAYLVSGVLIGVAAGLALGEFRLEHFLAADFQAPAPEETKTVHLKTFGSRIRFGVREAVEIVQKVWLWVLIYRKSTRL